MTNQTDLSDAQRWALYSRWLDAPDGAVLAIALICLIHQANFLLDRQITALERAFVEEGGYSEQLAKARLAEPRKKDLPDAANLADLGKISACPLCGGQLALRTAKTGPNMGKQFGAAPATRNARAPKKSEGIYQAHHLTSELPACL